VGDSVLEFEDGDLVTGTVVKIDHDEVLLDIGFKSEGVIPARELSIRNDVDPSEIVSIGDKIAQARRASSRRHLFGRQLRRLRGPRRHGRTHPRLRTQLEAHRSPEPSGGRR